MLFRSDSYSYLLALLTAEVSAQYVEANLWRRLAPISDIATRSLRTALNQFSRAAFVNSRLLVWPAQALGIERLARDDSFTLCTPTGSGKTVVATIAAMQALFGSNEGDEGGLVLYLVPSRALAAEVEARFAKDLSGVAAGRTVVTGLYGGIDWGPTDAWIQSDKIGRAHV